MEGFREDSSFRIIQSSSLHAPPQSFMDRKRLQVERMLRDQKEAASAPNETRKRVLREEMARARQVMEAHQCGPKTGSVVILEV